MQRLPIKAGCKGSAQTRHKGRVQRQRTKAELKGAKVGHKRWTQRQGAKATFTSFMPYLVQPLYPTFVPFLHAPPLQSSHPVFVSFVPCHYVLSSCPLHPSLIPCFQAYLSTLYTLPTCLFRWLKFTLKPPNSMAIGNFFLAIWDTSHWNFLSNLDSRHLMTSPRTLLGKF